MTEHAFTDEDSEAVVQHRSMTHVGKVSLARVEEVMDREVVFRLSLPLLDRDESMMIRFHLSSFLKVQQ